MYTVEELQYAQRYPISNIAKRFLKEKNLSLDDIPDEVIARARAMIIASYKREQYKPEIRASKELLENEIIAFPVAKIMLSEAGIEELYDRFAGSISKSSLYYMEKERDENLMELGRELGIEFDLSRREGFFIEIDLFKFLDVTFREDFMKLVNLKLENGKLYLTKNDFVRFLAAIVYKNVLASLPVETTAVPNRIKQAADLLGKQLKKEQKIRFKNISFGKVKPDLFPACMKELYSKILEGKNLTHIERFSLATFLVAVGMQQQQVIDLFRNTPNFNEKITKYQISRIVRNKISPPSCAKMRSNKLCIEECKVRHPVQYYRRKIFQERRPANK